MGSSPEVSHRKAAGQESGEEQKSPKTIRPRGQQIWTTWGTDPQEGPGGESRRFPLTGAVVVAGWFSLAIGAWSRSGGSKCDMSGISRQPQGHWDGSGPNKQVVVRVCVFLLRNSALTLLA